MGLRTGSKTVKRSRRRRHCHTSVPEGREKKNIKNSAFKEGQKVVFADLKVGDYVVHKNYGIGIFIGVNTITADGTTKDYIKIKYYGDDILYVPTNQLDSIRKYVGGDEGGLKVNKLGTKEWLKTKAKVKKNLREVAQELIQLYAKREKAKGYAFSKDTPWQIQFEDSFPYQETDDQLRCIDEVKKDMETNKPMDRLLCGDVGYGSRAGLKTLILENGAPGGKLIKTNKISNYPGIKDIEGTQLAMDMFEQATSFQAEYAYGEVNKIDKDKNVYLSDGNVVKGEAIILATGTKERLLNIPGENENLGHGVSFCAVCDGAFFRDKDVVVIGGGNSALEESIYLAGLARSVTIVIRRDVFRAEEHIQKQIEENAKIHVIKKHIPVQILSLEGKVSGIELENVDTHEKQVIECSGIFPYVGQDPNTDCVQDLGVLNERGYVLVDDDRQTKIPGIYAAGDVIDKNLRQVITACNDGAIAAQHAFHKIKGI